MTVTPRSADAAILTPSSESPWLSLAESRLRARAFRVWNRQQRHCVALVFERLLLAWGQEWGVPDIAAQSAVVDVRSPALGEPGSARSSRPKCESLWSKAPVEPNGVAVWWTFVPSDAGVAPWVSAVQALQNAIFGERSHALATVVEVPVLAAQLAQAAWADWWRRVGSEFQGISGTPTMSAKPWDGSLQVDIPWGTGTLTLRLDVAQVQTLLERHAPNTLGGAAEPGKLTSGSAALGAPVRVSVLQALSTYPLRLRAQLRDVELNIGQLQGLRVGDVVPLGHRLDTPTDMVSQDGRIVCHGWLGQNQGQVAVEMAASANSHASMG